jgi:hypothetical protein
MINSIQFHKGLSLPALRQQYATQAQHEGEGVYMFSQL